MKQHIAADLHFLECSSNKIHSVDLFLKTSSLGHPFLQIDKKKRNLDV